MQSSSKDVCDILENNSALGLAFKTNLFIGREPATPNDCVTIFDIPGEAPLLTLDGGVEYYRPGVQVRVRDNDYTVGWELIHDIQTLLHGIHGETWNGTSYMLIQAINNPFLLDWDESNRARFVVDFRIQRK